MNWLRRHWPMLALIALTGFLIGFALHLGFELNGQIVAAEVSR